MKKLRAIFKSLKRMQNLWKVRAEHKNFLNTRKKIIRLQRWLRKKFSKMNASQKRRNVMLIQMYIRRYIMASRFSLNEVVPKVVKLQNSFRNYLQKIAIIKYKKMKNIVMVTKLFLKL